jgi:hypothetical protein
VQQYRLTESDSADIEFATTCLIVGTITFDEFKQWLLFIAENADDVPLYVFKLREIDNIITYLRDVPGHIGFGPAFDVPRTDMLALHGIAIMRFKSHQLGEIKCKEAVAALLENPAVEGRFRISFPFIDF